MYGNPETTPGGRALKFYASVRIDIRRGEQAAQGRHNRRRQPHERRRLSRTRSRRRSEPRSSIFSTARASARKAACRTARLRWISSINPARGSPTATSASVRAAENTRKFLKENAEIAAEIDKLVRAELMEQDAPVVQSAADDDDERPTDDGMDDLPNPRRRRIKASSLGGTTKL